MLRRWTIVSTPTRHFTCRSIHTCQYGKDLDGGFAARFIHRERRLFARVTVHHGPPVFSARRGSDARRSGRKGAYERFDFVAFAQRPPPCHRKNNVAAISRSSRCRITDSSRFYPRLRRRACSTRYSAQWTPAQRSVSKRATGGLDSCRRVYAGPPPACHATKVGFLAGAIHARYWPQEFRGDGTCAA
jgi:hypothetical protein